MKRAQHGPTWCVLCKEDSESTDHIFLKCRSTMNLWKNLKPFINFVGEWAGTDLISTWTEWEKKNRGTKSINLPIIANWAIWKARNSMIFENKPIHWPLLEASIVAALRELPDPPLHQLISLARLLPSTRVRLGHSSMGHKTCKVVEVASSFIYQGIIISVLRPVWELEPITSLNSSLSAIYYTLL